MRYQSELAEEFEKWANEWLKEDPFHVDMYQYIVSKLKEKYEIKEK